MKMTIAALLLLSLVGSGAWAKNCKKGKPCGNACISKNDVCHKDENSSGTAKLDTKAPAESQTSTTGAAESKTSEKVPKCVKGKACGDSCIPKDEVCHK